MFLNAIENIVVCGTQDTPVMSYDITTDEDKAICSRANDTSVAFDNPKKSILDWNFESDSDTALFCHGGDTQPDTCISYAALNEMVLRVHSFLVNDGIKSGDPIGLLIRGTAQAVASIYGVASLGGILVVVDPEKTPVTRAREILDDANVTSVLMDDSFVDKFGEIDRSCNVLSLNAALECKPNLTLQAAKPRRDDVFGYYYTSGTTTGKPKGAVITYGNVMNLINWWCAFFELNPSDRVLLFSSLSFIMSLRQYLPTLCSGGTIVLPSSSINFERAIVDGKVNKIVCTPSALAVLDVDRIAPRIKAVQVAGK